MQRFRVVKLPVPVRRGALGVAWSCLGDRDGVQMFHACLGLELQRNVFLSLKYLLFDCGGGAVVRKSAQPSGQAQPSAAEQARRRSPLGALIDSSSDCRIRGTPSVQGNTRGVQRVIYVF